MSIFTIGIQKHKKRGKIIKNYYLGIILKAIRSKNQILN